MLGIREHDEYNLHLLQQRKLLLQLLCVERKGNINMWNIFVGKGERRWEVKGVIPLSLLLCGDCFLGVKWCCVDFLKGMPGFYMDFFPFLPYLLFFSPTVFVKGMCKYFGMLWRELWRKEVWVFTQEDWFWLAKPVLLFLWCLPLHMVCSAIHADLAMLGPYWFTLLTLPTHLCASWPFWKCYWLCLVYTQ